MFKQLREFKLSEDKRENLIERIDIHIEAHNIEGINGYMISEMIKDEITFDDYVKVIRFLERLTQDYAFVKKIINVIYEVHSEAFGDEVYRHYKHTNLYPEEVDAICSYVSEFYEWVNGALLGDESMTDEISYTIDLMDMIMDKTEKLNGTLYRGQHLDIQVIERIIEDKEFTFKNFVSTSMTPIIFGGWLSNSTSLYCENRYESETGKMAHSCNVSWVIDVKDHKGFVVGSIAWNPCECEVILPRGTCVKINDVVESFGDENRRQFTIFCEVTK